jgi:hypothetical protein
VSSRQLRAAVSLLSMSASVLCWSCGAPQEAGLPEGPFLGQETPGDIPQLFAPGVVSTGLDELNAVFSPGGDEFFFSVKLPGATRHTMMVMKSVGGRWTKPQVLPFSGRYADADPAFSPDGTELLRKRSDWAAQSTQPGGRVICASPPTNPTWSSPAIAPVAAAATICG